jgi:hypothetical protein
MHQGEQGDNQSLQELVDVHLDLDPAQACEPQQTTVTAYIDYYQQYLRYVAAIAPLYV